MDKYIELFEKLSHLQWLLGRRQMRSQKEYGPYADPSRGQGRVLTLLKMQPEISTRDLSYLLGIRQQSLNELLNKLEKSEYVVREPSEADRRVMLVKLTEKGKAQQQQVTDYSDIFFCLSEEEQTALAGYLDRITAGLEAQLGEMDDEKAAAWCHAARDRMGHEQFERMMAMHPGRHGCRPGPEAEHYHRGHDRCGHGGHGEHNRHRERCDRGEYRGEHKGHGKNGCPEPKKREGCYQDTGHDGDKKSENEE